MMPRFLYTLIIFAGLLGLLSSPAFADSFDRYREVIDNYRNYDEPERARTIKELQDLKTKDIEKNYLLGMLYYIQGFDSAMSIAKNSPKKPRLEEVVKVASVKKDFDLSEKNYDIVQKARPGYKYIYCKYVELFRVTLNGEGLKKVTLAIGKEGKSEATDQCRTLLENIAQFFATRGYGDITTTILHAAVTSWEDYPKYMLGGLGDAAQQKGKTREAKKWWQRCVKEAKRKDLRQYCKGQLEK